MAVTLISPGAERPVPPSTVKDGRAPVPPSAAPEV